MRQTYTCPRCGRTSHNPNDALARYCGHCHSFEELEAKPWVIWSEEHGAWWAPGKWGYTESLAAAGRYSQEEAQAIVEAANRCCKPGTYNECGFPDPIPSQHETSDHSLREIRSSNADADSKRS